MGCFQQTLILPPNKSISICDLVLKRFTIIIETTNVGVKQHVVLLFFPPSG